MNLNNIARTIFEITGSCITYYEMNGELVIIVNDKDKNLNYIFKARSIEEMLKTVLKNSLL